MQDLKTNLGFRDLVEEVSGNEQQLQAAGLQVACLETVAQMRAMENEWRALEKSTSSDLVYFQSYQWCLSWWMKIAMNGQAGSDAQLRLFTVRRGAELVMIWPLMVERGPLGLKILTSLGGELSQYGGALIDQNKLTPKDVKLVWSRINAMTEADIMLVDRVPQHAPLAAMVEGKNCFTLDDVTSIVDLSDNGANTSMLQGAKASTRRNRKKRRKKLADGKELKMVAYAGGTPEYADMVELLFQWKDIWFRETGRPSSGLQRPGTKNFIASLTEGAFALILTRDGQPIAGEVGFKQGRHFYSYLGAFDWSLQRLSPGRVQIEEALHWLVEQDVKYYDLLGAPSTYKQEMSDLAPRITSYIQPLSLLGHIYGIGWLKTGRPLAKSLFYRLSPDHRKFVASLFAGWREKPQVENEVPVAVSATKKECHGCANCSRQMCNSFMQGVIDYDK